MISSTFSQHVRDSFSGRPWFGEALMSRLDTINCEASSAQELNLVASLVKHLISWRMFVIRKLLGDAAYDIELNSPEDWPKVTIRERTDWQALIDELRDSQQALLELLEAKSDAFMEATVPGKNYSYQHMLTGLLQHDAYHQGQIALKWKSRKSKNINSQ